MCSTFFDGDVMSAGHDGIYDENNEEFVKVVILGRGVPYVI